MAVLDEDFGADLTLVEGDGGVRSSPAAEPVRPPRDWQMLYEQAPARAERERVRADAAEARAEELRWAEVAARSDAGSWKSRFRSCRRRLSEANEEAKELRRAAKAAPSLRAEAVRLETLLSEAGNGSSETGAIEALGKEVARLREALAKPEAVEDPAGWRSGEAGCDPASREEAQRLRATIRALRKEAIVIFAGGSRVDDGVTVDPAHPGRRVVVGIDRGDLGNPIEVRQVESQQGIFQVVAGSAIGDMPTISGSGSQIGNHLWMPVAKVFSKLRPSLSGVE